MRGFEWAVRCHIDQPHGQDHILPLAPRCSCFLMQLKDQLPTLPDKVFLTSQHNYVTWLESEINCPFSLHPSQPLSILFKLNFGIEPQLCTRELFGVLPWGDLKETVLIKATMTQTLGNAGMEFTWKFCLSKENKRLSLVPLLLLHIKNPDGSYSKLGHYAANLGSGRKWQLSRLSSRAWEWTIRRKHPIFFAIGNFQSQKKSLLQL